jgi:hypothetical protein
LALGSFVSRDFALNLNARIDLGERELHHVLAQKI